MGYLRAAEKEGLNVSTIFGKFWEQIKIGIDIDVVGVSTCVGVNHKKVWLGCIYKVVKSRDGHGIIYESEVFVKGLK